jgi:hypothetical protein
MLSTQVVHDASVKSINTSTYFAAMLWLSISTGIDKANYLLDSIQIGR